ncbi:hypothetical protein [Mycobacterium hubeiense]|uniref:hypothetical protein n=1 Tax=Mycobacterium hubeiense TaxID=1867256 RepID=UPI000C7F5564|nr:hypothetical protein [Mycobacterium sp. QGD 101]
MDGLRRTLILAAVISVAAGCTSGHIVNTGEKPPPAKGDAPAPVTTPASNVHLVDAFDYAAHVDGQTAYYFTTPSGRWRCAIVPRVKAGCQSASGSMLGIAGAPDSVTGASGETTTPNAILVDRDGDPRFAALEEPEFWLDSGPANALPFNKVLAAAGFRCNVQEATGVSCTSESTRKGFTFSAEGVTWAYTDVPA